MSKVATTLQFCNSTPNSLPDPSHLALRGLRIGKLYAPQNIPERPTTNTGRHRHVPHR